VKLAALVMDLLLNTQQQEATLSEAAQLSHMQDFIVPQLRTASKEIEQALYQHYSKATNDQIAQLVKNVECCLREVAWELNAEEKLPKVISNSAAESQGDNMTRQLLLHHFEVLHSFGAIMAEHIFMPMLQLSNENTIYSSTTSITLWAQMLQAAK